MTTSTTPTSMGECLKGQHSLDTILSVPEWDGTARVVRWCVICGAVVVDVDIDGRVSPGHGTRMRFPLLARAFTQEGT